MRLVFQSILPAVIAGIMAGFCRMDAADAGRLKERAEYQAALTALAGLMPQVAALKFEKLLLDGTLDRSESVEVAERLADALVRSRQPDKALVMLTLFDIPDAGFWKAQAYLLQGRFRDAESQARAYLAANKGRYLEYARLALAQSLIGQSRENTGRKELKELTGSKNPEVARLSSIWASESESLSGRSAATLRKLSSSDENDRFLEFIKGSAWVESGDGRKADTILRKLLDHQQGSTARLHHAVVIRLAEAWNLMGRKRSAEKLLQRFIDETEESPFYDRAFALLDSVKSRDDKTTLEFYAKWAGHPSGPERKSYALYYHARELAALKRTEEAIRELEAFREGYLFHPRSSEAMRLLMSLHGALHNDDRVLELARDWRARFGSGGEDTVDFLTAMIRFSRSEFTEAAALFQRSAETASDIVQKQHAIYNMGVAALLCGRPEPYVRAVSLLKDNTEAESSGGNLELERALHLAARRDGAAEEALRDFLKNHPEDPRWVEAQAALAEYCLLDIPPRIKAAQAALDAASARTDASPEIKERLDYTRLWLCEGDENFKGVCEAGESFMKNWPKSGRRDEVRMKMAQAYFRLEDYPRARAQFEQLAEEQPVSPYADVALFFAARAAMSTLNAKDLDKALDHLSEVVQRGGQLANEARRQMALIKRLQGRETDALATVENMLTSKPPPQGEELLALQMEKNELLALLAKQDPKNMEEAIAGLRSMVLQQGASRYWRARAGVLLAQSLQRQEKSNEALEACSDVIELYNAATAEMAGRDLTWFYRAGFLAVDILESQKQWNAAAKMADRLAQTNGDRAAEARERANRIRLEHFIWDK